MITMEHLRTWQASHGRCPWLFIGDIPDKEGWKSNQSTEASIAYANVYPTDPHCKMKLMLPTDLDRRAG